MYSLLALVVFLVISALPGHSFWIISHNPLVSQRLDPILAPNGTSSHTHTFVGSAAILSTQDKDTMCTTSGVKADKSNYWAPQLYFYHAKNSTFASVPLSFVNTYYLNRGGPKLGTNPKLTAFPKGLKMIAGNNSAMDAPDPDATKALAVSYVCLNYADGSNTTKTLPTGPCPQGLRTQIVFPSCWDGKNLDSTDHQSHMSYPIDGVADSGDCPTSHPVKLMTLFYEFIYATGNLKQSSSGKSRFVLANGDAVGYAMHADFVADWDVTVLQAAVDQCTGNLFGDLKSCPPFVATLNTTSTCKTKESVKEKVLGSLKSLPGCVPIKNGPSKGAIAKNCTVPTLSVVAQQGGPDDAAFPNRRDIPAEHVQYSQRRLDLAEPAVRRSKHREVREAMGV